MKTKHQLLQEWNESTYGLEFGDYVYQYFVSQFNKPPVCGQWIDVKERLPEPNILVLCVDHRFNRMMVADWMDYTNQDKEWFTRMFTHWTTLPPSPGSVDVEEKKEPSDLLQWLKDERNILSNTSSLMWHKPNDQKKTKWVSECLDTAIEYIELSFPNHSKVDGLGDSSGSEKEAERRFPLHEQDSEIPCISINDIQREYRQVFQEGYNYAKSVKEVSREGENQEQLWKEVFHQSGSRMDFMQFLQKHFTITRKPSTQRNRI